MNPATIWSRSGQDCDPNEFLLFMFALLISGIFEPKIRLLHALQALIFRNYSFYSQKKSLRTRDWRLYWRVLDYMFIGSATGPLRELFSGHLR